MTWAEAKARELMWRGYPGETEAIQQMVVVKLETALREAVEEAARRCEAGACADCIHSACVGKRDSAYRIRGMLTEPAPAASTRKE